MTVMQCIDEFVRKAELRVPLYTNEIYEYVKTKLPDTDKATFNMTLQRYEKRNPDFVRYQKGVYYKTVHTPFGVAGIDTTELIKRTYLVNGDEVIGYESGPSYMNKIGLTTQMPNMTYIFLYTLNLYLVKCRQHHGSAFGWTIPTKHHSRQQKTF